MTRRNSKHDSLGTRYLVVLLTGCALIPLNVLAQTSLCDQAMTDFRASQWSASASAFAKCEAARPGQTDSLLYRGKALINLNKFNEAAASLSQYVSRHPDSDDGLYTLAYVRFRQDQPRESLQIFNEAAKLKPPGDDDLKIVALDYVLLHDYDDAAHYLEVALQMNPKNVEARYHLGRVRYQQNQFDAAIAAFAQVLKEQPNNVKAQDNLGLSFEGKNQLDLAVSAYRKAVEIDEKAESHTEQPYIDLGSLLARTDHASEAIAYLKRATEIDATSGKAQYELAKTYLNLNQLGNARAAGESAIQRSPSEGSYHYLLGRIYAKLGKADLASQQFKLTEELLKNKGAKPGDTAMGQPAK
jgi:tetratricopeptide (TPR) repeat protein